MPTSQISLLAYPELKAVATQIVADAFVNTMDLQVVRSLYQEMSIPNNSGTERTFASYATELYANNMVEGGDAELATFATGLNKTMYMRRFGKNVEITHVAKKFGNDSKVISQLTSLANYVPQRLALDLTHRFTFASDTSYVDMDGQTIDLTIGDETRAVIYSAHTLTGSSDTYSNVITGNPVFSKGSYEMGMLVGNTQQKDDYGNRINMGFNTIVTGDDPATVDSVLELLYSNTNPTQDNSGVVNNYKGAFRHVILKRLATTATGAYNSTKAKRWFMLAVGSGSQSWTGHLGIWENAYAVAEDVNIKTDNITIGSRGAWGICVVSGLGIAMSTGLGI
jgi:hypothetical protein